MSFAPQMRIKGILLLLICVLVTTVFYCLIGDQKPIESFVFETHKQLSQPLMKFKQVVVPAVAEKSSYYLNNNQRGSEEASVQYLQALGFVENPRLFLGDQVDSKVSPVFVTAVKSGEIQLVRGFIKSLQDFDPDATLILYSLDLDHEDISRISKFCNISTTCTLRKFEFENFPSHVKDLTFYAFRPIILQEVLNQTGAALWLDPNYYIISEASANAKKVISRAKKEGILSWTIEQPTTAMTHPRMFDFFDARLDNYYFHRMVEPSSIILYNTKRIHQKLMLPWVRCALTYDCIAPIGAQSTGCRFDKKPLYRYSGCHHYDMSALNIVLGTMFNYNEKPYVAAENEKFFKRVSSEELSSIENDYNDLFTKSKTELASLNATTSRMRSRRFLG